MQGLQTRVLVAAALMCFATSGHAQVREPSTDQPFQPLNTVAAEESDYFVNLDGNSRSLAEPAILTIAGASFIKVHFSQFDVPYGVLVEVSNPDGSEVYRYSRGHRDAHTIERCS